MQDLCERDLCGRELERGHQELERPEQERALRPNLEHLAPEQPRESRELAQPQEQVRLAPGAKPR